MSKLIKDGMVAVVFHSGYGFGYSVTNNVDPMNKEMAEAVIAQSEDMITDAFKQMTNSNKVYFNWKKLEVCWIPVGKYFYITEHDGYESVITHESIKWLVG